MRKITYKRKSCYITEAEHKSLLDRFNPAKFEVGVERETKCILCEKYQDDEDDCINCPVSIFDRRGNYGCVNLIRTVLKNFEWLTLGVDSITVRHKYSLRKIAKIHKALKKLKKVKGRGK